VPIRANTFNSIRRMDFGRIRACNAAIDRTSHRSCSGNRRLLFALHRREQDGGRSVCVVASARRRCARAARATRDTVRAAEMFRGPFVEKRSRESVCVRRESERIADCFAEVLSSNGSSRREPRRECAEPVAGSLS
jgi:hypothetical protein